KVLNSSHIFFTNIQNKNSDSSPIGSDLLQTSSTNLQSPTNEKSIDKDSSQIQNEDFQSKDEIEKMIIPKTILLPKKVRKRTNRFLNSAFLSILTTLTILIVPVQETTVISLNPRVGTKSTLTLLT
ncbi:hypothetical protein LEP1GSC170_0259, partial [Leptospira interrogans serovar Bataviae str. HAI135]